MKNRLIKFVLIPALAAAFLSPGAAYAQDEVRLSYLSSNTQLWRDSGFDIPADNHIEVAVKFPKEMFETFTGMDIVAFEIAWGSTSASPIIECWVRNELDGENLTLQEASLSSEPGDYNNWVSTLNRINLDSPVTITPEMNDIFIGYSFTTEDLPAGDYNLLTNLDGVGATTNPKLGGCQWIINHTLPAEEGGQEWNDMDAYPMIFLSAYLQGGRCQDARYLHHQFRNYSLHPQNRYPGVGRRGAEQSRL